MPRDLVTALLERWRKASVFTVGSIVAADRATFTPLGGRVDGDVETGAGETPQAGATHILPEWRVTLSERRSDRLGVGDHVEFTETITDDDIRAFARASGETDPPDGAYEEEAPFDTTVAHGALVSGLVSAVLTHLPGEIVYLTQDLEFHAPISSDDRLTAIVEIVESLGADRFRSTTTIDNGERTVIEGEAIVQVDGPPELV